MHRLTRREYLKAGFAAIGLAGGAWGEASAPPSEFSFHHDHVLGTSLDLWLRAADAGAAEEAERAVLDEVERLRRVFSLYDPDSELGRLNRSVGPVPVSVDLRTVLRAYQRWQPLSGGACNAQVGALVQLWAEAEQAGRLPDPVALAGVAREIARPGFCVEDADGTVTRLTDHPLNLNAVAKGYVIAQAVAAVAQRVWRSQEG